MTRDEQVAKVRTWVNRDTNRPLAHVAWTIVEHVDELLEVLAECGVVERWKDLSGRVWHAIPGEHEHVWRVGATGTQNVVVECDDCSERWRIPNTLPIVVPL